MTTDVMIDLETWANTPDAAIRSIGAVQFDIGADDIRGTTFYANVDDQSCTRLGLLHDPQTEQWWASQSEEAKKAFETPTPIDLQIALFWLADWIKKMSAEGAVRVWSHGAGYDLPILRYAFSKVGYAAPWSYRNERDTRTLFQIAVMADESYCREHVWPFKHGVHHNALDDAITQARQVQMCWAVIR